MQSLFYKIKKKCKKFMKYLYISKKSSTFASDLKRKHNHDYILFTKIYYLYTKFRGCSKNAYKITTNN